MSKQVHYKISEDMQKYIEGFNPDDYEETGGYTDPSVISYARGYYDNHLPIDVMAWMRVNEPEERLIYGKDLSYQVSFICDTICTLLLPNYDEWQANIPMVISTHYSKSVKLPVYQINLEKYGIEMVLSYNFYHWAISIKSKKPLDFDFMNLFNQDDVVPPLYCHGFPSNKVYGSYSMNHSQFTFLIDSYRSYYDLYTFMYLLKNYLNSME